MGENVQQSERTENLAEAFGRYIDLLFHSTVREVRLQGGGNPIMGLIMAIGRTLALLLIFMLIFLLIRAQGGSVRGDPILFLISGILLFLLHNMAVAKTVGAGAVAGPLMAHAPMTPTLAILSATVAGLYLMILAGAIILCGLYLYRGGLDIDHPAGMMIPILLAWSSGVVIGLLFLSIKPFAPRLTQVLSMVHMRANMITSGKFFVANSIPAAILPMFTWNPLFHSIDQLRGEMFINYYPKVTSLSYPIGFVVIGLVVGMMIEFWLRKTVSRSLSKRQT